MAQALSLVACHILSEWWGSWSCRSVESWVIARYSTWIFLWAGSSVSIKAEVILLFSDCEITPVTLGRFIWKLHVLRRCSECVLTKSLSLAPEARGGYKLFSVFLTLCSQDCPEKTFFYNEYTIRTSSLKLFLVLVVIWCMAFGSCLDAFSSVSVCALMKCWVTSLEVH